MNLRQKKKQYKKQHGHNPRRGEDGHYLFQVAGGWDMAGVSHTGFYKPERVAALKAYRLKPEDIEPVTNSLRDAFSMARQAMADFAETVSQAFSKAAEQCKRPVTKQEEPIVVVARHLTERRKKCRRKEWKASQK